MIPHKIGDLVVMLETVEWDDRIIVKGELCIVSGVYDTSDPEDDIFFDYAVCAADGITIDVWHGEIESLDKT